MKFQRVQEADPGEHADLGHADIGRSLSQAGQGPCDEQKRQAGGEPQEQHGEHPRISINPAGCRARTS